MFFIAVSVICSFSRPGRRVMRHAFPRLTAPCQVNQCKSTLFFCISQTFKPIFHHFPFFRSFRRFMPPTSVPCHSPKAQYVLIQPVLYTGTAKNTRFKSKTLLFAKKIKKILFTIQKNGLSLCPCSTPFRWRDCLNTNRVPPKRPSHHCQTKQIKPL